jgi:Mce-associated membrane protein
MKTKTDQQYIVPSQRSAASSGPVQAEAGRGLATARDPSGGRAGARSTPTVSVMFAIIVALLVAVALLSTQFINQWQTDRAADEALATARSYASTVTTYDYRVLDTNFAAALTGATGWFKSQYTDGSKLMRSTLGGAHTVAKGTVIDAGITSLNAQQVTVALFVDQSVTNSAHPQPQLIRSRMLMTLVPQGGRWLVSQLQLR